MCGIAGAVSFGHTEPASPEVLGRMLQCIRHRGPDDEGTYLSPNVALGMRRLSIVDVKGGHQPISNEDGTAWIILNGEIFNYPALRKQLEERGHKFGTNADTEAVVHAYEEWGDGCVERLNGQFAFALWDTTQSRLLMARDRVGIKPLHYSYRGGLLVFGSEIKAMLAHPSVSRELDLRALDQYLTYEHVPVPRTMFQGIEKLAPGHYLVLDRDGLKSHQYWDFDLKRSENGHRVSTGSVDVRDWEEQFREALQESVRMELMSDVPLGVFLSGGLDSSAIAACMVQALDRPVQSFSIAFEDPSFDESRYASRVARHLGLEHREQVLTEPMMWELVPRLAEVLDEPLGDSSIIPCYLLAQFARKYVTVALGGDGGDELLAGYSTMQAHRLTSYYNRIPSFLRHRVIAPAVQRLPVSHNNLSFDYKAKRFVAWAGLPAADRHHLWLGSFSPAEKNALLRPEVRNQLTDDAFTIARDHYDHADCREDLNRILYTDMKLYLDTDILAKVDRSSMAHALESRVPLLNTLMLDLAAEMPLDLKLHGFTRKYLMRRAMKGVLPDGIVSRPKKGFNIPVAKWFRGALKSLLLDVLSRDHGVFDMREVDRLIKDHLDGTRDNRKQLWTLLVFQLWYDRWLVAR